MDVISILSIRVGMSFHYWPFDIFKIILLLYNVKLTLVVENDDQKNIRYSFAKMGRHFQKNTNNLLF